MALAVLSSRSPWQVKPPLAAPCLGSAGAVLWGQGSPGLSGTAFPALPPRGTHRDSDFPGMFLSRPAPASAALCPSPACWAFLCAPHTPGAGTAQAALCPQLSFSCKEWAQQSCSRTPGNPSRGSAQPSGSLNQAEEEECVSCWTERDFWGLW